MSSKKYVNFYNFLYFLIFFTLCLLDRNQVACNLWDNIFSNLKSPLLSIPEEFKLELYNSNSDKYKSGEMVVSVKHNKIRLSLYESLKITNTFENLMTTLVDDLIGRGRETEISEYEDKPIFNMIIDFNTNSSISIYANNLCQTENITHLDALSVKFLLVSYDLFTYYEERDDVYYDYIFTNTPIKYNMRSTEDKMKKLNLLFNKLGLQRKETTSGSNTSIEDSSLIVFRVSKKTSELEKVILKYNNIELFTLRAKITEIDIGHDNFTFNSNKNGSDLNCNSENSPEFNKQSIENTILQLIFQNYLANK